MPATDSFIIEFPDTLEGFSKFIIKNREHFDFSGSDNTDIPLYHHLQEMKARLSKEEYDIYINYGTPGKFKSETLEIWPSLKVYMNLMENQKTFKLKKQENKD